MTIGEYIAQELKTDQRLPFDTQQCIFPKKHVLTETGQVETHVYFLQEGIVEAGIHKEGEDRIIEFFYPHQFVSSYTSFLTQRKSDVYLVCLTDCKIERMNHTDLVAAYQHSLVANQLGRHLTERAYLQRVQKEKDFLVKSAEERYLDLLAQRPKVAMEIPVSKIAKYLGIHPESLSRIRKSIS